MKIKEWFKNLFTKKDRRNPIELRIDELAEKMKHYSEDSEQYSKMADQLVKLTEANAKVKETEKKAIDGNVLFNGFVAFAQIIVILVWEERHVIRSEATRFMTKLIGRK